jgi:DNA repair protein RecN (Recombination protein N)
MLTELRISRLGVIEHAELSLGPGLTVLTGETGAGKTMVLTALGLLLGGRADPGAVRAGAERADVEGWWDVGGLAAVRARAEDAGAAVEDDELVVARTVGAEGRSRATLGGRSVPLGVLTEIADDLVAVHSQSAQVALVRPDRQRDLLDAFGAPGTTQARSQVSSLHARLLEVGAERDRLRAEAHARATEAEDLRLRLDEIDAVAPQPQEVDSLAAEQVRLAHADRLREHLGQAQVLLAGDESAPAGTDVLSLLAAARRAADRGAMLDPAARGMADRLAEAGYLLGDLAGDLAGYLDDLEADPVRLTAVNERLAALGSLGRRYGGDVPAVLTWADQARQRLLSLESDPQRLQALEAEHARLRTDLGAAAHALSQARQEAGARLAAGVTAELRALAMPDAVLTVQVRQREDPDGVPVGQRLVGCASHGADQVQLLLAAHPGVAARPLDRGASGGELARTMLALEVVLATADPVPTLVFDEVDAGVGGRAAVDVGRRLARLARHTQVLVVTHLAQVAAFADRHYVVHKDTDGQVTASGVRLLADGERASELARMMAGLETSQSARRHAQELLAVAAAER